MVLCATFGSLRDWNKTFDTSEMGPVMLTRRGFAQVACCALCAITGFVATEASAAEGAAPAVIPGPMRKILSQMDGPMSTRQNFLRNRAEHRKVA